MKAQIILLSLLAAGLAQTACTRKAAPAPKPGGVVSLAPNLTEMVCALGAGDRLAGRSSACNYPPQIVGRVPILGGFGTPSLELIAKASPAIVLEVDMEDKAIARRIEQMGIRCEHVACRSLDDIPKAIVTIGSLLGCETRAGPLASHIADQIAALRKRADRETARPSVYVEFWHDPMMTAGRGSFLSELVYLAGGRNIGDEAEQDYYQVSPEWIISQDPDVILCLFMAGGARPRTLVESRQGWSNIRAVRRGAVYDSLDTDLLLRPGPRVLEGIEELRKCIRPQN